MHRSRARRCVRCQQVLTSSPAGKKHVPVSTTTSKSSRTLEVCITASTVGVLHRGKRVVAHANRRVGPLRKRSQQVEETKKLAISHHSSSSPSCPRSDILTTDNRSGVGRRATVASAYSPGYCRTGLRPPVPVRKRSYLLLVTRSVANRKTTNPDARGLDYDDRTGVEV